MDFGEGNVTIVPFRAALKKWERLADESREEGKRLLFQRELEDALIFLQSAPFMTEDMIQQIVRFLANVCSNEPSNRELFAKLNGFSILHRIFKGHDSAKTLCCIAVHNVLIDTEKLHPAAASTGLLNSILQYWCAESQKPNSDASQYNFIFFNLFEILAPFTEDPESVYLAAKLLPEMITVEDAAWPAVFQKMFSNAVLASNILSDILTLVKCVQAMLLVTDAQARQRALLLLPLLGENDECLSLVNYEPKSVVNFCWGFMNKDTTLTASVLLLIGNLSRSERSAQVFVQRNFVPKIMEVTRSNAGDMEILHGCLASFRHFCISEPNRKHVAPFLIDLLKKASTASHTQIHYLAISCLRLCINELVMILVNENQVLEILHTWDTSQDNNVSLEVKRLYLAIAKQLLIRSKSDDASWNYCSYLLKFDICQVIIDTFTLAKDLPVVFAEDIFVSILLLQNNMFPELKQKLLDAGVPAQLSAFAASDTVGKELRNNAKFALQLLPTP